MTIEGRVQFDLLQVPYHLTMSSRSLYRSLFALVFEILKYVSGIVVFFNVAGMRNEYHSHSLNLCTGNAEGLQAQFLLIKFSLFPFPRRTSKSQFIWFTSNLIFSCSDIVDDDFISTKASIGIYTMLKVCVVGSRRKTYTILLYQTYRMATLKPAEGWLFIAWRCFFV